MSNTGEKWDIWMKYDTTGIDGIRWDDIGIYRTELAFMEWNGTFDQRFDNWMYLKMGLPKWFWKGNMMITIKFLGTLFSETTNTIDFFNHQKTMDIVECVLSIKSDVILRDLDFIKNSSDQTIAF